LSSISRSYINNIHNPKARVIISRSHRTIVPSTGSSKHELSQHLAEPVRRNHPEVNESPGTTFYQRALEPIDVVSAENFLKQLVVNSARDAVQGISVMEGSRCIDCGYRGAAKMVTDHMRALTHVNGAKKVDLQQLELHGQYYATCILVASLDDEVHVLHEATTITPFHLKAYYCFFHEADYQDMDGIDHKDPNKRNIVVLKPSGY
jgi:hypothetical protein